MSKQLVKYQETTVDAEASVAHITALVKRYGGTRFEQLWDETGGVAGVRFAIRHPTVGELPVSLQLKTGEIERILSSGGFLRSLPRDERMERIATQAERIAWRHEKDLIEQLLLSVTLGTRSLEGAFMAEIETWDERTGETVTMEEMFSRRAVLSSSGRGVEIASARNGAIELPAAHL